MPRRRAIGSKTRSDGIDLGVRRWRAHMGLIRDWAEREPGIRLAMIVGSRARRKVPADRWSDTDVVLFVSDPEAWLGTTDWLAGLGNPAISFVEGTAVGGSRERRVLFDDGLDFDFAVFPAKGLRGLLESVEGQYVLRRGFRVLVDKVGWNPGVPPARPRPLPEPSRLPTREAFSNLVADFWYHAVWTGKKLRRGEVWVAKSCCDGHMKGCLLQMLEWQARSRRRGRVDTWHSGRFFEKWVEPGVVKALSRAFARYDARDISRSLWSSMDLFGRVARDTSRRLRWTYPSEVESSARRILAGVERLEVRAKRPRPAPRSGRRSLRGRAFKARASPR